MRKIIMDSKIKILIGVLVIGVIIFGIILAWGKIICIQDSDCFNRCMGHKTSLCWCKNFQCSCGWTAVCSEKCTAECEKNEDCPEEFLCDMESCKCIKRAPTEEEPAKEQVTITTDKMEYEQGETAGIILRNDRNSPIYLDLEHYTYNYKIYLEEYETDSWKASNYNFAQRIKCAPGGQGPAIGCLEIEGKNTNKRSVRLSYQICTGGKEPYWETGEFPKAKYIELPKGKYRLKIYVKEKCDGEEGFIYSNEFTIK